MDESVHAVGRSAVEVRAIISAELADEVDHHWAEHGPGSYQLVRSYRPAWAVAAGVATAPLLGLGLLFFLVRKVDSCTITVTEGSRGAVVTFAGRLVPDLLGRLSSSIQGKRPAPAPAPVSTAAVPVPAPGPAPLPLMSSQVAPPTIDEVADEDTVFRPARHLGGSVVSAPASHELRFDDGQVLRLEVNVVVGRDPSTVIAGAGAHRRSLEDAHLSKAHAIIGEDEAGPWVEDLHSTNGTFVHVHGEEPRVVAPGARHRLTSGSVVRFGTRFAIVSRAD